MPNVITIPVLVLLMSVCVFLPFAVAGLFLTGVDALRFLRLMVLHGNERKSRVSRADQAGPYP